MSSEIRVYDILNEIGDALQEMKEHELLGAETVIHIIHRYLNRIYFEEQVEVNTRALTKTMEDLQEICVELFVHKFNEEKCNT